MILPALFTANEATPFLSSKRGRNTTEIMAQTVQRRGLFQRMRWNENK